MRDGQYRESADLFARVASREPTAETFLGLGQALKAGGDPEAAREAFEHALRLAPRSAAALAALARVLRMLGDHESAVGMARRGIEIDPLRGDLLEFLTRVLPAIGRADELLAAADRALATSAGHTAAWYSRAVALAALERCDEAARIMDRRLIHVTDAPIGTGWRDLPAFSADLSREILDNRTLQYEPHDKTTRGGVQTRELMTGQPPALVALLSACRVQVEHYVEACRRQGIASPVAMPPPRVRMHAWATVLEASGHQAAHIHRDGWVSGVYYVADGGAAPGRGTLCVPATPRGIAGRASWPCDDIEPRVGRLVLFPSYFPHRTTPTGTAHPRISVAFDVIGEAA